MKDLDFPLDFDMDVIPYYSIDGKLIITYTTVGLGLILSVN